MNPGRCSNGSLTAFSRNFKINSPGNPWRNPPQTNDEILNDVLKEILTKNPWRNSCWNILPIESMDELPKESLESLKQSS